MTWERDEVIEGYSQVPRLRTGKSEVHLGPRVGSAMEEEIFG